MLFDGSGAVGGFGATPFGTYFGAGSGGSWGLFESTFRGSSLEVSCEACGRVRSQKRLGGCAVFGLFITDNVVGLAVSDALRPTSCYALRVSGPDGAYEITLSFSLSPPPAVVAPPPAVVVPVLPPGAEVVNTVLVGTLPEISEGGTYTLTLIDRCCGCESPLATVTLEGSPMLLTPQDADIGGAPISWTYANRITPGAVQPAGSTRPSIPFDKCTVVVEYDSRTGVLPDLTGWTQAGTGAPTDWTLVPGGALRLNTTTPDTNYYEKIVPIPGGISQLYAYLSILRESINPGPIGEGFELAALYGLTGSPYEGVRLCMREQLYFTQLDNSNDTDLFTKAPSQWIKAAGGKATGGDEAAYERAALDEATILANAGSIFGQVGVAGADELRVGFGNTNGALPVAALVRDIVVADGRFIRARFTGLTQISSPKLRLYLSAEQNGSAVKTARFKVMYGPGTSDPYGPQTLTAEATVNMAVANTVYEVPLSLPGLTSGQPFWFSLERDWNHADDQLGATVHLFQATMRSQ
jgi:hypothetical protein